jgi:enamine deaminase RidA (YjgF/YER057c/UK114 family)
MTRQLISTGSPFEKQAGYSRAVVQGPWCFVSGTTGYDYTTMTMPEAVADQARNALKTIAWALDQAGFALSDVVRVTAILTDPADFDQLWPVMGDVFGEVRPANTTLVAKLVKPEMKVEIEVTALKA